ncbi:hypothetical protein ACFL0S_00560 [Thermodesulfobacteriota bacterium]
MYNKRLKNHFLESSEEYVVSNDQQKRCSNVRNNQSDTLVIHPDDPTTDFLSEIYKGKGYNVVDDPLTGNDTIAELIKDHKRIIALGHGCGFGLFGGLEMMISSSLVSLLKDKELIFIWCNADQFMMEHQLHGFYSGMFISEVQEALIYGISTVQNTVTRSNNLFAAVLGRYIDGGDDILENVKAEYFIENDPVITFNRSRLYNT